MMGLVPEVKRKEADMNNPLSAETTLSGSPLSARRPFLRHIHHFRGIAILLVVISHVIVVPVATGRNTGVYYWLYRLTTNVTVFFVLISGFLFQYIHDHRGRGYWATLGKKLRNIYLPMLIMSLPALLIFTWPALDALELDSVGKQVGRVAYRLALGQYLRPFWYIPFIMTMFVISPLLLKLIKLRGAIMIIILWAAGSVYCFPRSAGQLPSEIFYFAPLFTLGAWMSYHYDSLGPKLGRHWWVYGIVAVGAMVLLGGAIPFHAPERVMVLNVIPVNIRAAAGIPSILGCVFKTSLALAFWGFLRRFEETPMPILDRFATYSFGIYFVHSYFLALGIQYASRLLPAGYTGGLVALLAYCIAVPICCLWISMLIKLIFRRYARYIAGV
jgi:membrane-bound acyltransferase YfiQ involved in biofilm formation